MAPQPQGPMTQGHLKRAGTQDADSIHAQVQMMNMIEVPFPCGFFADSAMQACPLGSKRYLQQPTCLQPRCPSGFTAKEHESPMSRICGNIQRRYLPHTVDCPSVTPVPPSWFDNPSHMKTEKSENAVNRSGKFWLQKYKKISLVMVPKVISLFQLLMYEHKSSAFTIAEMRLENRSDPIWTRTEIECHCS